MWAVPLVCQQFETAMLRVRCNSQLVRRLSEYLYYRRECRTTHYSELTTRRVHNTRRYVSAALLLLASRVISFGLLISEHRRDLEQVFQDEEIVR